MSGYDGPRTPGTIIPVCRYCGTDVAYFGMICVECNGEIEEKGGNNNE